MTTCQAIGDEANHGSTMGAEQRIKDLGLELPMPPEPAATFESAVRTGSLLFVSGHGPMRPDETFIQGRVGDELDLAQAQEAARLVALGMLSTVRAALGSLDRVVRVVKVYGMVHAIPGFRDHPEVLNGFSNLLVEVFGDEIGMGARSAAGMASLPLSIPVEIEAIFEVAD